MPGKPSTSDALAADGPRRLKEVWQRLTSTPGAPYALIIAAAAWLIVMAELVLFAVRQPVWSPIDEYNHFFYINSLNFTHRPPLIGQQYIATLDPQANPALSVPPSRGRGVAMPRVNFATEGIQPPGYYALMIPAFRSSPHGTYDQVIHVRLATAALAALLIPLTFVLARVAAPNAPWVWGAAAVVPALSRGYTFNLSQVTNDSLAALLGSVAVLAFLWLVRRRLDWRWGLIAGIITGVAAATKVTAFFIALGLAAAFVIRVREDRPLRRSAAAAAIGVITAAIIAVPWLWFNWRHYHALVGTTSFPANLSPYHNLPLPDALNLMIQLGSLKFWSGELTPSSAPSWLIAAGELGLTACTLGFVRARFWKERPPSSATLILGWTAVGLTYLFVLVLSTHVAILTGRYLYPLFGPIAVVCAVGAYQLGRPGRWLFAGSNLALGVALLIGLQSAVAWVLG